MSLRKLLDIEPDQELAFRFEVGKQASASIRLYNNTLNHVAFKFMISTPREKYYVRPNADIIPPGASSNVKVIMAASEVAPSDLQCKDKILIKSVVVNPQCTVEQAQELFDGRTFKDGDWKLRVVYYPPPHQQFSIFNGSGQEKRFHGAEQQNKNGSRVVALVMRGIGVAILCLMFWHLFLKMLPLIWSTTFMIIAFALRLGKRLVTDSVEDWIGRGILYLIVHFFGVFFQRKRGEPEKDSRVSTVQ